MQNNLWKKGIVLGIILLFVGAGITPCIGGKYKKMKDLTNRLDSRFKKACFPYLEYDPQDIDLRDAAFHKPYNRRRGEWWYFEVIFDNGYSIVFGVAILSKDNQGICIVANNIYRDTELEYFLTREVPLSEFEASEEYPFIKAFGNPVIALDREIYNTTGQWVYNISMEIDGQSIDLTFIGTVKGYKGEILRGWYGPVLPRAIVNGTLTLDGDIINVSNGLGYHEHGWSIPLPIWELGWYWGKVVSNNFTLYLAKMMLTRWWEQGSAVILSLEDSGEYIKIDPKNYKFKTTRFRFHNWRFIPTRFRIEVNDPDNSIYIEARMETINIHHVGVKPIHYWKYHVKVNGKITCDSINETIKDEIQIMEITRFR